MRLLTRLLMKKKPSYKSTRKCKIRINLQKFESIIMMQPELGIVSFVHCLN